MTADNQIIILDIVATYGADVYRDKTNLALLIENRFAYDGALCRLLLRLIQEDATVQMYNVMNLSDDEFATHYYKIIEGLEYKIDVLKDTLYSAVNLFFYGLGIDCSGFPVNHTSTANSYNNTYDNTNTNTYNNYDSYDNTYSTPPPPPPPPRRPAPPPPPRRPVPPPPPRRPAPPRVGNLGHAIGGVIGGAIVGAFIGGTPGRGVSRGPSMRAPAPPKGPVGPSPGIGGIRGPAGPGIGGHGHGGPGGGRGGHGGGRGGPGGGHGGRR